MTPALQIIEAHKRFGDHAALRGVSLEIGTGEIVCLLGASGSGKTTLLRLVAGLERLDRGSLRIAGNVVDTPGSRALAPEDRGLGMVFQDYALWPHLDALDNVALALRSRGLRDAGERAMDMLKRVGLGSQHARKPHELSGGQQQRVALARALAVRPRLLLCDEPLSNLDAGLREELRELIAEVVREHGLSALYITHDHREAFALGDRVGILHAGSLLQIDTPRQLLAAPRSEHVARFVHALGPWPAHARDGAWHAPWGALPAPSMAPAGADGTLYLPASALQPAGGDATGPRKRVSAEVLRSVPTPQGVELHARLHGVLLRLQTASWHLPGERVELQLDARQALIYAPANSRTSAGITTQDQQESMIRCNG